MEKEKNIKKFFFNIPDSSLPLNGTELLIDFFQNQVEEKDHYTKCHSNRVSEYSVLIGQKLGLSKDDLNKLYIGGLFHDIGKISIPDNILKKETKLTDDEYYRIQSHTELGVEILTKNNVFKEIVPIVEYHHEKYDGNGYPFKLKGDQIPLMARITSIADSFDAMTSKRTYNNPLSVEKVIEEFKKCSGSQFDPTLTNVFLDILKNEYYKIEEIQKKYI